MAYLKLFYIQAMDWVLRTAEKMKKNNRLDADSWNTFWEETYFDLGGKKPSTACKGCPKKAAYTLWYLGRIKNTGRNRVDISINEVVEKFSKNGAYAVLGVMSRDLPPNISEIDVSTAPSFEL